MALYCNFPCTDASNHTDNNMTTTPRVTAMVNGLLVDGIPMRTCKKCGNTKPIDRFESFEKLGKSWRRGTCYDCRNQYGQVNFERLAEYRRSYNAANRSNKRQRDLGRRSEIKAYVDELKKSPCTDCRQCFPPVCMDFDHVGPKNLAIAGMVSGAYRLPLIIEELKNCELVCANCHRIRTASRKDNLAPVVPPKNIRRGTFAPTLRNAEAITATRPEVIVSSQCKLWTDDDGPIQILIAGPLPDR